MLEVTIQPQVWEQAAAETRDSNPAVPGSVTIAT